MSRQQQLEVPLVSIETCEKIFGDSVPVHEGQLCAGGEEGKDACSGFGGAPLLISREGQFMQVKSVFNIELVSYAVVLEQGTQSSDPESVLLLQAWFGGFRRNSKTPQNLAELLLFLNRKFKLSLGFYQLRRTSLY